MTGHQSSRTHESDFIAELGKEPGVGASHPRVGNVPDNCDGEARNGAFSFGDCECVTEGLSGVLVFAIAGVDDGASEELLSEVGGAAGRVADHESVESLIFQGQNRVSKSLSLSHRAPVLGEVDAGVAEGMRSNLEPDSSSGGAFEEKESDELALLGFRCGARADCLSVKLGAVEEVLDLGESKVADGI